MCFRSVIVTGTDDWTVFSNNDEECRVIKFDYADGYPGFFRDLPDIGIEWTIKRAVVGCLCKDDPYVYCNIDEKWNEIKETSFNDVSFISFLVDEPD